MVDAAVCCCVFVGLLAMFGIDRFRRLGSVTPPRGQGVLPVVEGRVGGSYVK